MTDADVNCFASELSSPSSTSAASPRTPTKNVQLELEPTSPFVLRAPASAKSKLILQNMEEVLNTVKQKHREKHKRKREEKRRAAAEAAAAAASTSMDEKTKSEKPQPLREKATQENGLSSSNGKSLSKKSNESASAGATPTANLPILPSKPTNVFELMMKARNRSLGVNEGAVKELPLNDSECSEAAASPTLGKRKQLLQEWNDRKGGSKRRLADEQRGEFIGQQLEKRAKRFKKMLTQESPTAIVHATASAPTLPIAKRGRGRPRRRRLSSVDAEIQKEQEPDQSPISLNDPQTAEFLSKLSSPTKKRDSLLGYFAKVETPKNVSLNQAAASLETPPQETPKRRPRRTNNNNNNKLEQELESSVIPFSEPMPAGSTPSGRPRRSCANKARYDYDLETSPIKSNAVAKDDNSIEIIDLDTSNPPTTPKKLAPLFVRQLPKPSPDPSVLKARQDFLHSGVPERIRQEQSRLKQLEQQYDENYELFPRIAHIGCSEYKTVVINLPKPWSWRQAKQDNHDDDQDDGNSIQTHARLCDPPVKSANHKQRPAYATLPSLDNKRSFVKLWKNEFDRFPTFKCYNQMREKYRHFSAMDSAQDTQQVGESFVVTRRSRRSLEQQQQQQKQLHQQQLDNMDEVKPPMGAPNGELLFTEKYKPLLFEQVLVNLTPVQELKEFLSSWSTAGGGRKNSQDDFNYDTMDSSSCSMTSTSNSNTMVLVGPSSSGKTNAVFALANDLNFNVLEINAGMRRTGKKLMQELQEATQSHQIRKDNKSARGKGNSGNLLQKMQKSSISNDSSASSSAASGTASSSAAAAAAAAADVRKSLILIEDADIVFEQHDAGFTEAIYTLANSSKRPVIVVATNPNCSHLQRLMQQNCIHFHAPNALNISRFLAVLSLMENCPIELDELVSLYLYNAQNLRKTLMELQFYIQSGGDPKDPKNPNRSKTKSPIKSPKLSTIDGSYIHQRLFEFYTCTQNKPYRIPFPLDFNLLRLNLGDLFRNSSALETSISSSSAAAAAGIAETNRVKRKSRSPKKAWLINSVNQKKQLITPLDTLASFYENISIASQMDAHTDHSDRLQSHLSEDISHLLVEQALLTGLAIKDDCPYNLFDKPVQRTTLCDQLGSYQLRTATTRSLDYEPILRSICRSERERSTQERRSSRFYHYLRNHLVNVTNFSMESCEAVCHVLQSTPSNSSSLSIETQSSNNS